MTTTIVAFLLTVSVVAAGAAWAGRARIRCGMVTTAAEEPP